MLNNVGDWFINKKDVELPELTTRYSVPFTSTKFQFGDRAFSVAGLVG